MGGVAVSSRNSYCRCGGHNSSDNKNCRLFSLQLPPSLGNPKSRLSHPQFAILFIRYLFGILNPPPPFRSRCNRSDAPFARRRRPHPPPPVSYTHLTLPTI